jgi:sugar/nucleoside kinase (ribokinase family)
VDVLCVGHAAWDINLFLDGFPPENSKCEIRTMLECGGGPAANAAYLLSRWGVSCGLAAATGQDEYGCRVIDEFTAAGTDVTLIERSPDHPTPVSVILVNERTGTRTIVNRKAVRPPMALRLPAQRPKPGPQVLLFDGHELEASLTAMERFPDAQTILDAGSLREGTQELARRVRFLVASERFARQLSGVPDLESPANQAEAVAALHTYNGNPVAITRGEQSVLYGTADHVEQLPAFAVKAVDTTAAGDIFHGAFAYGVLRGLSYRETLRLAAATAALSVTARGGRTSIPALAQVEELLRHGR